MRGSCIDVVDSFRTLVDASTRHLDLPSTGNKDRATVIGCCNYANARIQPVSPKYDVMKTGDCHDRDNSRLAPSKNARKANTGTRERT